MTASISIANSDAAIKFNAGGTFDRVNLRFNNSSTDNHLFACYSSGQKPVQIYKLAKEDLEPEVVLSNVEINHGKVAGVLTVDYTFEIANYNDGEVAVKATIAGMENITFAEVEAPAAAPAREAAGNKVVKGTLKAKDAALKGEQSLIVNVVATLDGEEIYNDNHAVTNTTGIEDVTVDGNEAAEYFNLQGVRVAQPEAGRVYIVRRGAKATKELVK